jgi:Na+/H+-dicarboxylate symporter
VEAWANIFVGFTINYAMNAIVFSALLGIAVSWRANVEYGVIMTLVSLLRSYVMRRVFNGLTFGNKQA